MGPKFFPPLSLAIAMGASECSLLRAEGCWDEIPDDLTTPEETGTDSGDADTPGGPLVEICYAPGSEMADGELFLSGASLCAWEGAPADRAVAGDLFLCSAVEAGPGDTFALNAAFVPSSDGAAEERAAVAEAGETSWTGTVYVSAVPVAVRTLADATDGCASGPAATFQVPD